MKIGQLSSGNVVDQRLADALDEGALVRYLAWEKRAAHAAVLLEVRVPEGDEGERSSGTSHFGGSSSILVERPGDAEGSDAYHQLLQIRFPVHARQPAELPSEGYLQVFLKERRLRGPRPAVVRFGHAPVLPEGKGIPGAARPPKPYFPFRPLEFLRTHQIEFPGRAEIEALVGECPTDELHGRVDARLARVRESVADDLHCLMPAWTEPLRQEVAGQRIEDPVPLLRIEDHTPIGTSFGTNTLYLVIARADLIAGRIGEARPFVANC